MATDRKILQWLENQLFDGALALGQELPDERHIASAIGATRNATHQALKDLETLGVVRLFEGKRRQLIAQLVRDPAASAAPGLKLHMATAEYPLRDIVHTRVLMETWAVRRADPEHPAMRELAAIMDEMDREDLGLKDFHRLEVSFHVALTRLAGNSLITGLTTSLRDSVYEYTMSLVGYVPLWSATATRLRAEHRAIYAAIESGDNELAARMVAEHIEGHYLEAGVDPDRKRRSSASVFVQPETDAEGEVQPLTAASPLSSTVADSRASDADLPDSAPARREGLGSLRPGAGEEGDVEPAAAPHDAGEPAGLRGQGEASGAEKAFGAAPEERSEPDADEERPDGPGATRGARADEPEHPAERGERVGADSKKFDSTL
ncbi:FCD domain-containing protein [Rothia sp. AR01]|uniref:FCD domain-containing protein n=1 Tax=Rothia santali TaxID=2949643 RepID=A0A9X2HBG0_9MICC|nr:FCD domain-containing protein [Rothia santali]MCP3425030.1 FCD domain-containing protein [Rothia santali]